MKKKHKGKKNHLSQGNNEAYRCPICGCAIDIRIGKNTCPVYVYVRKGGYVLRILDLVEIACNYKICSGKVKILANQLPDSLWEEYVGE